MFARLARRGTGLSLIEVIVVMAVIALLSTAAYPVAQIYRQREKERRLREMLYVIRQNGIQAYRLRVLGHIRQLYPSATSPEYLYVASYGVDAGNINPPTVASLYNPIGPLQVSISPTATATITINSRFIRPFTNNWPPHPFVSWYPAATWAYDFQKSGGVKNIRSQGAGLGLDGTDTNNW